jgi:hypothetical protein
MVKVTSQQAEYFNHLSDSQKKRAVLANEIYQNLCDELGLRVCSWEIFGAWQDYVNERMEESQLEEKARAELQNLPHTFGKYLVVEKEEPKGLKEENEKRQRAKLANQVYKKVCNETGLTACFFHDFSTWSDYVKGDINESELYNKAKDELKKKMLEEKAAE